MKKPTKTHNKADIITLYAIALVCAVLGVVYNQPVFYIVAIVLILLGLFRKYWLMKRLKK